MLKVQFHALKSSINHGSKEELPRIVNYNLKFYCTQQKIKEVIMK